MMFFVSQFCDCKITAFFRYTQGFDGKNLHFYLHMSKIFRKFAPDL